MPFTTPTSRRVAAIAASAVVLTAVFGVAPAALATSGGGVIVTPADIASGTPWSVNYQDGTATWQIVPDSDAYFGNDALRLTTPANNDDVGLLANVNVSPTDFTMSYATKQLSAQSYALPGIFAYVELNNTAVFGAGASVYVGYEPIYNNPGALDTTKWQDWSFTSTSNVWMAGNATVAARYPTYTIPFSTFSSDPAMANAKVMGVYLNQGSGNAGWDALLDKVNLGGDTTYNFELAADTPPASPALAKTGAEPLPIAFGGIALLALGAAVFSVAAWRRKALLQS